MDNDNFIIKSDGSFVSQMGQLDLIKAKEVDGKKGYHFFGVASTADKDRDGETLLQKGLDFTMFNDSGEYNWNHVSHALVGLPVGKKAFFDGGVWKAEGLIIPGLEVLPGYTTEQIVKQHNQLKKSGFQNRGLCMSVEGKVLERSDCGKYVKKASIYNIALTFRPVNPNCTIGLLAKSMAGRAEVSMDDEFYKSLGIQSIGSMTKESLEGAGGKKVSEKDFADRLVNHLIRKGYSQKEAVKHVLKYFKSNAGRKTSVKL